MKNQTDFTNGLNGTMFQADGLSAMLSVFAMSECLGLQVVPTAQELSL